MDYSIQVYVRLDENKTIIEINSSTFIEDTTDWLMIDKGIGDKYSHAQNNYLPKGLVDLQGKYNYKYDNGRFIELGDQEKEELYPTIVEESQFEQLDARITYLESLHQVL